MPKDDRDFFLKTPKIEFVSGSLVINSDDSSGNDFSDDEYES